MPVTKTISAAVAALAMSGGIAAAQSTTNDLNMRTGPGPQYQVIGVIPAGAPVNVLGCSGSWCQVNYGGRAGFASASYLSGDARAGVVGPNGPVSRAPVASGPVYGAPVYGAPVYGAPVYGAPAYGPTYGYVDRGDPPSAYQGYTYDNRAYDDDDDDDDDDGDYARSPTVGVGVSFGDRGWRDGRRWD